MMNRNDDMARRRDRLAARRASLPSEKQAALMELLQTASSENSVTGAIPRRPQGEMIPLSFAQERLWIWDQLNPGSVAYNISLAGQITGRLNLRAMNHSLSEIIRR